MTRLVIKLVTLATFLTAPVAAPSMMPAFAAGGGGGGGGGGTGEDQMHPAPKPPTASGTKATTTTNPAKKKSNKQSSLFDDPAFANGYRAAYATIYDRNDYADAIEQLKIAGLEVSESDGDNDVVEGTILTTKIGAIKMLGFVKYVRDVFDYYSEKDDEEAGGGDLDDVDDARR